jgi:hypothetical protein
MEPSPTIRLLLLALLPVVGLAVYLEGQDYDPALIQFAASDASVAAETAFLPEKIGDFTRAGALRRFTEENLYEYVNGHAEYFISAGFEGLAVGEYFLPGADPSAPGVIVDIYDMGKGVHAFGVYADEVGGAAVKVAVGEMGARTPQGLSFVKGKYFVKIAAFEESVPVETMAARIDELIGTSPSTAGEFSRFPDAGEVKATRFIKESYRGMDFAGDVVERTYDIDGKTVHLSLSGGDAAAMEALVDSYLAFFEDSGVEYRIVEKESGKLYRVIDPYEGDWHLVPGTDAVFGIYGDIDEGMLDRILRGIESAEEGRAE